MECCSSLLWQHHTCFMSVSFHHPVGSAIRNVQPGLTKLLQVNVMSRLGFSWSFCMRRGPAGLWHLFHPHFHQLYLVLISAIFSQISAPRSSSPFILTDCSHAQQTTHRQARSQREHTDFTEGQIRQEDMTVDRQPICKKPQTQLMQQCISLYNMI